MVRRTVVRVLTLLALAVLLAACSGNGLPQSTWEPAGSPAEQERNIIVPVFWVAAAVFVVVEGGVVLIAIRYRHRKGRDRMPPQTHGNTRLEIGWTIVPAFILTVVMVPTIGLIWQLARPPTGEALNVTVEGHQWWWAFRYTDDDLKVDYGDHGDLVVADVLVIPVDRQVYLSLESVGGGARDANGVSDFQVIHSFWVPRLAGKQDVVPGRTNHILLEAAETGMYWGQCAEFCGLQHGEMRFRVVVLEQDAWEEWVANEQRPPATTNEALAAKGMDLFLNGVSGGGQCIACHAVGADGAPVAPNLTHFAAQEHSCFAGCTWDVTDDQALRAWLENPDAVRLGSKMPDYNLTPEEIDALVAYLYSLK